MTGEEKKVAIVTGTSLPHQHTLTLGAAQGIGEAIALRLAKDGFNVVLADLPSSEGQAAKVAKAAEAFGAKTSVIAVDVSKKAQVDALVEKTVAELGRLDVMVANAGIAPVGPFMDVSEETIDKLHAVNVKGVLFCYQAAARQMIKQGWGGRLIGECDAGGGVMMCRWRWRS